MSSLRGSDDRWRDKTDLLGDSEFMNLMRESNRQALTWRRFASMPMPNGLPPVDAFSMLSDFNKNLGIEMSLNWHPEGGGWYLRTLRMSEGLSSIQQKAREGSPLHEALDGGGGAHFLMKMRVADIISAAKLDGLGVPGAAIEEVVRLERRPANDSERFVLNVFKVEESLASLVNEPFSMEMLEAMNAGMMEGVDGSALTSVRPKLGLIPHPEGAAPASTVEAIDFVIAYANDELRDDYDSPVLRGFMLTDNMRYLALFEHTSSQVGRLMTKLYMMKHGLPVLAVLPMSKARVEWEEGELDEGEVVCTREDLDETARYISNTDCTLHQEVIVQLTLLELERTEQFVEAREKADREMREALRDDVTLNARQRTVLGRALRRPDAEFTIRYHKSNHNIAYATARADLMDLVKRGFLDMKVRGKAFVFTPSSKLRDGLLS